LDATTETEIIEIQPALKKRLLALTFSEERHQQLRKLGPKLGPRFVMTPYQVFRITDGSIRVMGFNPDEPFKERISFGHPLNLKEKIDIALFRRLVSSQILARQLTSCPECERIFLIRRKPRTDMAFHCSIRCSRNAATRRYRERLEKQNSEEVRSKERERS